MIRKIPLLLSWDNWKACSISLHPLNERFFNAVCASTAKNEMERLVYIMDKFYDYLNRRDRIDQSGGAVLRVTGDHNIPLMNALLSLRAAQPEMLDGLVEIVSTDGETLRFSEVRQFHPPYLKALGDISQFLQDSGYEAASKFLDCSFEL